MALFNEVWSRINSASPADTCSPARTSTSSTFTSKSSRVSSSNVTLKSSPVVCVVTDAVPSSDKLETISPRVTTSSRIVTAASVLLPFCHQNRPPAAATSTAAQAAATSFFRTKPFCKEIRSFRLYHCNFYPVITIATLCDNPVCSIFRKSNKITRLFKQRLLC